MWIFKYLYSLFDPFSAPEFLSLCFLIFILKLFPDSYWLTLTKMLLSFEGTYIPSSSLKFWQLFFFFFYFPPTTTTQLSLEVRQVISFTPFPCLVLSNLLKLFLPSTCLSQFFKIQYSSWLLLVFIFIDLKKVTLDPADDSLLGFTFFTLHWENHYLSPASPSTPPTASLVNPYQFLLMISSLLFDICWHSMGTYNYPWSNAQLLSQTLH